MIISCIDSALRFRQLVIETLVKELILFWGIEDPHAFHSHRHQSLINIQLINCWVLTVLKCLVGSKEEARLCTAVPTVHQQRPNRL